MEEFDLNDIQEETPVVPESKKGKKNAAKQAVISKVEENAITINPLRNERVIVRYLPKKRGIWGNNPKHVLAGGMSENATKTFVVPRLSSGTYVNILTNEEKAFFENALGLEPNALSVHRKTGNFWSDSNPNGINQVKLKKQDNYLNLSIPEDYIKYKILLANKNLIAPSLEELQDRYKATYQYVIINEHSETKIAKSNMSYTMECYKEYGKIEEDKDKLRVIVETLDGRPIAESTKLEFLQAKCNDLIQRDAKIFLKVIKDPYLNTKVLIRQAVSTGNIARRGDYYYIRNANETIPMCEDNEQPTYNIAAKYLNNPKHQEVLLMLQAKMQN